MWEETHSERVPCLFILDEASIWLPQNTQESMLSREKDTNGQTLLARMQQAFFATVVRRGRKRGMGFLFATQRIAELDKRCIQCDWLILFRQTLTNDLARYAEMGISKEVAQALEPGEAVVIDPRGEQTVQQFRRCSSPDASQTPGPEALSRHAHRWAATRVAPMFEVAPQPLFEELSVELPLMPLVPPSRAYSEPVELAPLVPMPLVLPEVKMPEQGKRAEEIDLRHAIFAWNAGENNRRKLAKYFGLTEHQAKRLVEMIKNAGNIQREEEPDEE